MTCGVAFCNGVTQLCAQAVELTLGLSEADLASGTDASFTQLGGDSLAAIQFARTIDELCGVPLPVSFVLDHSNSLAAITAKARRTLKLSLVQPQLLVSRAWAPVLACASAVCRGQVGRVQVHCCCKVLHVCIRWARDGMAGMRC